jgi:hypothetical protein
MAATLTAPEQRRLEDHIRELMASGAARRTTLATAFLRGVAQ